MVKCTDLKNDVHLVTTTPSNQPSSNKHDSRKFSPKNHSLPRLPLLRFLSPQIVLSLNFV